MKRVLINLVAVVILISVTTNVPVLAQVGGSVTLTSDYLFRGVSQTMEKPAIQGCFEYATEQGVYAGVFGSSVQFVEDDQADDGATMEFDVYLGYGMEINENVSFDINAIRYTYPETADDIEYDYNELNASVTVGKMMTQEIGLYLTGSLGWSPDAFATDETGIYYGGCLEVPASYGVTFTAGGGYYDLDDPFGDSYMDYNVGVSKDISNFTIKAAYCGTDDAGNDLFGEIADDRFVVALTAAF